MKKEKCVFLHSSTQRVIAKMNKLCLILLLVCSVAILLPTLTEGNMIYIYYHKNETFKSVHLQLMILICADHLFTKEYDRFHGIFE